MKKLILAFCALGFATAQGSNKAFYKALNYNPATSGKTSIIVSITAAATCSLTFFLLDKLNRPQENNSFQEAVNVITSPFKKLLSLFGININTQYPKSKWSYMNGLIALLAGYAAADIAYSFTPEGKFVAAQALLKSLETNETLQGLYPKNSGFLDRLKAFLMPKLALFENIDQTFIHKDHPHIAARDFFNRIKKATRNAYEDLTDLKIQDTKAEALLPLLKAQLLENLDNARIAINDITQDSNWALRWAAYRNDAVAAEKLRLEREKTELLRRQTEAKEHTAYYKN